MTFFVLATAPWAALIAATTARIDTIVVEAQEALDTFARRAPPPLEAPDYAALFAEVPREPSPLPRERFFAASVAPLPTHAPPTTERRRRTHRHACSQRRER